jgi:hypothetical protein
MNVVYTRQFFEDKKIKFAIVDQADVSDKHTDLFNKVHDLTFSLTTRLITPIPNAEVKFYNKIDDAMADSVDFDLIFIQSVGNLIKNNIILEELEQYSINNPDFFIMAFTLDWQSEKNAGWVEIHHQMLFVNINKWKEIGSPQFGGWDTVTEELPNYIRSEENFHDRYTPYWMQGAPGTTLGTRTSQGYGFLKAAFANDIKIDNFTDSMRKCRLFIYPESETSELYEAFIKRNTTLVTNPNQKKWIKSLKLAPTIWVYNSERYYFLGDKKCDTYFGTASGFKYLDILNGNESVKFVFYDFHEKSLDWVRQLKETWDGNNFPQYLENQSDEFKRYYKYINGGIKENQKLLFDDFGGEDKFKELWSRFKNCDAEYVKCNLFEIDQVRDLLTKTKVDTPFFFYSNIFATDYTLINFTLYEITNKYNAFLDTIFNAYPAAITNGSTQLGDWVEYTISTRK